MKFKFRLEKVLNHKRMERDLARRDYLQAQQAYDDGVKAVKSMVSEISEAKRFESESVTSGRAQTETLKWSAFFIEGQEVKIQRQKLLNRKLIQVAEQKQDVLIEKAKELKTLETLKEKMHERYKREVRKKDMKSIDDIVVMAHGRDERFD